MLYELHRHNEKYGALTVVGTSQKSGGTLFWRCRCKCGEYRQVEEKRLVSGQIATCIKCEVKDKQSKFENEKVEIWTK